MNAEPKADAHERPTSNDAGLTKFDAPVLKGITIGSDSLGSMALVPRDLGQAMEMGKLMSMSNFVPPHLRGKPGDCLAVVLISGRWAADPYAVASKSYFVQDRIAFEAQLINAVVNTRAPLDGRLHIEWNGEGNLLTCKVTGKIKGDPEPLTVWQEIGTITTKNSPLWKSSPRQQLAYYTSRMWARLYCPEVLLGIYTPDELEFGEIPQEDGTSIIPPRPTRPSRDDAETARKQAAQMDADYRRTMGHDAETGEIVDPTMTKSEALKYGPAIKKAIVAAEGLAMLKSVSDDHAEALAAIEHHLPILHGEIMEMVGAKRQHLEAKK